MARRLEGQRFYESHNNGVTAIATEEASREISRLFDLAHKAMASCRGNFMMEEAKTAASRGLEHLRLPIFTFAKPERVREQPWFTGDFDLLQVLVHHIKAEGGSSWPGSFSFYVPFSNGYEVGMHGVEAMEQELRLVTTRRQFRDTFGISYDELLERVHEAQRGMGAP